MQRVNLSFRQFVVLLLVCLLAGYCAVSVGYSRIIRPGDRPAEFSRIARDGWLLDGARIAFSDLLQRGNTLNLEFDPWRPAGVEAARIRIYLCDAAKPVVDFTLNDDTRTQKVYLTGDCEPRHVRFEVLNPFTPSPNDARQLGAQLVSAKLSSRLGLPLLKPRLAIAVGSMLLILAVLVTLSAGQASGWFSALCVAGFGGWVVSSAAPHSLAKLLPLWLLLLVVAAGFVMARLLDGKQVRCVGTGSISKRWIFIALLAVVILGGALRLYGIDFGLPKVYHPDEARKISVVTRMFEANTWDPKYFLHPSLLLYSTIGIYKLFELLGLNFYGWFDIYLAGRCVSALAGTSSIYLLYRFATRLFNQRVGLLSALVLAGLPLHVTCSRYMKEDALLVCFFLACAVALLKGVQEDRKGYVYLGGLLGGVCASSKYTGLLSVFLVLCVPWLRSMRFAPDRKYFVTTFFALCLFPIGFALCTPYSIFNMGKFLTDFGSERKHMLKGHTIAIDAWSQYWMYHFSRSILPGMTHFAAIVGLLGASVLLWRRKVHGWFVVALIALFYLPSEWVRAKPAPQPERYILPCLPFLAVAAAAFIAWLAQRGRHAALLAFSLAVLLVGAPWLRSIQLASEIKYDTRAQMEDWMRQHIPHGSSLYINGMHYAPQFPEEEFDVKHLSIRKPKDFLVTNLVKSGRGYVVVTSLVYDRFFNQPRSDHHLKRRFKAIFDELELVHEISPLHGTYGFHNPTVRVYGLNHIR